MNISPVSFKKAVYVNGSVENAQDVVYLVNSKKVKLSEKELQAQAKLIFDDANEKAPAQVYSFDNGDVYILSGEENKKAKQLQVAHRIRMVSLRKKYKNTDFDTESYHKQFNKYLHSFILKNESPFDLSFEMNKTKTRIKSLIQDWVKVFAIVGTSTQLEDIAKIINSEKGNASIHNATGLYIDDNLMSQCANAVKDGKKVAYVVTGKEATEGVRALEYGWSSLSRIKGKVERFIFVDDNNKKNLVPVLEAMKH